MKKTLIALSLIASTTLTGCAGLMSGGSDRVTISAGEQQDARIFVDGRYIGNGRVRTDLERGDDYEIKVVKRGCTNAYITTDTSLDPWIFANILIDWGIISIPIDLISGNAFELEQEEYMAVPECPVEPEDTTRVTTTFNKDLEVVEADAEI